MDQALKNYTEQNFVASYVDYIKKVQSLPSRPMVMLMVPVFTCLDIPTTTWDQDIQRLLFTTKLSCPNLDQQFDLQKVIYRVAKEAGIPDHHVVNVWKLLRLDPDVKISEVFNSDHMHPNLKGMGMIAQEVFMKMSLSQQFLERQQLVIQDNYQPYNQALWQQIS